MSTKPAVDDTWLDGATQAYRLRLLDLVSRARPVDEICSAITDVLLEHEPHARVIVTERRGDLLLLTYARGLAPNEREQFSRQLLARNQTLCATAVLDNQLITATAGDCGGHLHGCGNLANVAAGWSCPIGTTDDIKPLGTLTVFLGEPRVPDPADIALLEELADILARSMQLNQRMESLNRQALHDNLTGLANRHMLFERLDKLLAEAAAAKAQEGVGALLIDLNEFKQVNDRYGHGVGDVVLTELGHRLRERLRSGDIAARLGGDEFVVIANGINEDGLASLARSLSTSLEAPINVDDIQITPGVSIGPALSQPGESASALLRRADQGMYLDKGALVDASALAATESPSLEGVEVFSRPRVDRANRVIAMRLALSWQHPRYGPVSSDRLLRIARTRHRALEAEAALALGARQEIMRLLSHDPRLHFVYRPGPLIVQSPGYTRRLRQYLDAIAVPLEHIEIDLTNAFHQGHDLAQLERFIEELGNQLPEVNLGVGGLGHEVAALDRLSSMELATVGIDASFTALVGTDREYRLRALRDIAAGLAPILVAEGVADANHWRQLKDLDFHAGEGVHANAQAPYANEPEFGLHLLRGAY